MTTERLNRALAVVVCALLLVASGSLDLTLLCAMADSSEYPEPSYLVVITYEDWDDLQRLAPLGLHLLDLRESVLAAIVTPQELATLRSMGFAVRVLDAPATPEQYYLVTLPLSGETAPLYWHGQVFPYVAGVFILKADPAEAELLPGKGFFIKKLFGPIVLPTSPRSAEAVTPTVLIQEHNPLIQDLVNSVSQTLIYDTICELQDDEQLSTVCDAEGSRYSYSLELAEDFGISVEFVNGSFISQGADDLVDRAFADCDGGLSLDPHADRAYEELGLEVRDFDVVFAFPWPNEEELTAELFERFAARGALLLTYCDSNPIRLRRKVV